MGPGHERAMPSCLLPHADGQIQLRVGPRLIDRPSIQRLPASVSYILLLNMAQGD